VNDDLIARLTQEILQYEPEPDDGARTAIRVGDIGKCIRQTWYKMNATPSDDGSIPSITKDKFAMAWGNLWETYIMELFSRLGIAHYKHKLHNKEYNLSGETDPIIKFEDKLIITECKATHSESYQQLYNSAKAGMQPEKYYSQLQGYLWLYPKADFGMFIIGNRGWRRKDKAPPFFLQLTERDKRWYNLNFGQRIPLLNEHLNTNEPPPREFDNPNRFPCLYCPYRVRCYES
jgi:hypothetical protein